MSRLPSRLRRAIKAFKEETKARQIGYAEEHTVAGPCYHYTRPEGVRGILSSNSVHLMDYHKLRDAKEVVHGLEIALECLREQRRNSDGVIIDLFLGATQKTINSFVESRMAYFVASFCEDSDDVSLWDRYADGGTGCMIGFARAHFAIVPETGDVLKDVRLIRMRYDENELRERQSEAVRSCLSVLRSVRLNSQSQFLDFCLKLFDVLVTELLTNAASYKQSQYRSEREVRLAYLRDISFLQPHVRRRDDGRLYIPYVCEPSLATAGVESIWLGPSAKPDLVEFVRDWVRNAGLSESIIRRSGLDFRPAA